MYSFTVQHVRNAITGVHHSAPLPLSKAVSLAAVGEVSLSAAETVRDKVTRQDRYTKPRPVAAQLAFGPHE
jgi:hypothetical protein